MDPLIHAEIITLTSMVIVMMRKVQEKFLEIGIVHSKQSMACMNLLHLPQAECTNIAIMVITSQWTR